LYLSEVIQKPVRSMPSTIVAGRDSSLRCLGRVRYQSQFTNMKDICRKSPHFFYHLAASPSDAGL
jgi:hypothetical protein